WTLDHRGQILAALYTILAGNPRLRTKPKDREPARTRFKKWWHLVGSAIEHAADLAGQPMDFGRIFLAVDADDEESASLAEALQCLNELSHGHEFSTGNVYDWMAAGGTLAQTLQSFFSSRDGVPPKKTINTKLRANTETPVWVGEEIWILKSQKDSHL